MTVSTDTPAQILDRLLADGALASQYNLYIDTCIRTGDSFYTAILADEGREAAEAALDKWNRRDRMSDFAAGIEPVARGMLSLAQIDTTGQIVQVIEVRERMPFPTSYSISSPSQMIVVFNKQAPGCGCQQPMGSSIFAPFGRLGLKAVTLQVGYSREYSTMTAQLGLVLPYRTLKLERQTEDGYVVAAIELTGSTCGHSLTPGFYKDGALMYALGLVDLDRAVSMWSASGGHFDDAIGFPGATEFLADSLPGLGEYFTALAEKLSADHKH